MSGIHNISLLVTNLKVQQIGGAYSTQYAPQRRKIRFEEEELRPISLRLVAAFVILRWKVNMLSLASIVRKPAGEGYLEECVVELDDLLLKHLRSTLLGEGRRLHNSCQLYAARNLAVVGHAMNEL
jgi:hypothetical protein